MKSLTVLFAVALAALSFTALAESSSNGVKIVSVAKIWDAGKHNAFTDLIRFNEKWFCTFRESEAHVGGNGKIRVLTSKDGEHWESAALLTEEGIDLRDPKLSVTPDHRLMIVLGGSVYEGKKLKERQPRVTFSKNGSDWTTPQRVLQKDDWLWRVTWNKGHAYGISYNSSTPSDWTITLVESTDALHWSPVTKLNVPGHPNESTIRFQPNGDCIALVRRESEDKKAWIGTSSAPYTDWKWRSAGMQIGGPNFLISNDGRIVATGRQYGASTQDARTFAGRLTPESVTADVVLPSGGDCSYAGMVWYKGLLWVSYYSSHEGKTSIYLAKVAFPR